MIKGFMPPLILLALSFLSLQAMAAPKIVCTMTINSSDEKDTFVKSLPPGDFKFVELTRYDDARQGSDRGSSKWFENACKARVQCDILVVSAHFGGVFFGSSGFQLQMEPLEKNSCSNTCDGILKHPREVFLFGCNTLAEKNRDHRTQEQYTQILVQDGIGRVQAERIAETRYGAVGSTFKDRMRRVFAGVPHIYGFSSTAPAGPSIKPALRSYFQKIPDYSIHLEQMEDVSQKNTTLIQSLTGTSISESSGVGTMQNDPAVPYRQRICATYDTQTSIADRTRIVAEMLLGSDRLIYLNSAVAFFKRYEQAIKQDLRAQEWIKRITASSETMSELQRLRQSPGTSVALKLDLLHLDVQLGRVSQAAFETSALTVLKNLLHPLDKGNADLVCSSLRDHGLSLSVRLEDFNGQALNNRAAIYAMGCLKTKDIRITRELLSLGRDNKFLMNGNDVRAYLLTMIRLPGYFDEKLEIANDISEFMKSYKLDQFNSFIAGLRATSTKGSTQVNHLLELQRLDLNNGYLVYDMFAGAGVRRDLADALIQTLTTAYGQNLYIRQLAAIIGTLPAEAEVSRTFFSKISSAPSPILGVVFLKLTLQETRNDSAIDFAISKLSADEKFSMYPAYFLSKSMLNSRQLENLTLIAEKSYSSYISGLAKWILSTQAQSSLTEAQQKTAKGSAYKSVCESMAQSFQCNVVSVKL